MLETAEIGYYVTNDRGPRYVSSTSLLDVNILS